MVQTPRHSTFTKHDFRVVHNEVLPHDPVQPYDTKCQIDLVQQQQKKPGPSWQQPTVETCKKELSRNAVPIAIGEKEIRNEHTLYYVPPKKSRPGVPTQEGTLVRVAQEMESTEDDKKKNKNNPKNSNKKQETFKGEKHDSYAKQHVRSEQMVGNFKFPIQQ